MLPQAQSGQDVTPDAWDADHRDAAEAVPGAEAWGRVLRHRVHQDHPGRRDQCAVPGGWYRDRSVGRVPAKPADAAAVRGAAREYRARPPEARQRGYAFLSRDAAALPGAQRAVRRAAHYPDAERPA